MFSVSKSQSQMVEVITESGLMVDLGAFAFCVEIWAIGRS